MQEKINKKWIKSNNDSFYHKQNFARSFPEKA